MKRTLNAIAAIAIVGSVVVSSAAYAEDAKPRTEGMSNTSMTTAPAPRDEAAYWTQKKLEAQQKSTEMRKQRVQELQSKGIDTSSITPDLLDGTKTEEKLFWDTMKLIMQNQDASSRQKVADELKKAGYDTSSLTADILDPTKTDEPKFWNTVKSIRDSKNSSSSMSRPASPTARPNDDSMRTNGETMHSNDNGTVRTPNARPNGDMNQKPVLSEKMRQALVKKFNAVSDDKKSAYYAKTKANLEAQLEKAKANKNNRLVRKITETLAILDYVLGSSDDAADDDVINSATAE